MQHRTVLVIFPLILQTRITARMLSVGEEASAFLNTNSAPEEDIRQILNGVMRHSTRDCIVDDWHLQYTLNIIPVSTD